MCLGDTQGESTVLPEKGTSSPSTFQEYEALQEKIASFYDDAASASVSSCLPISHDCPMAFDCLQDNVAQACQSLTVQTGSYATTLGEDAVHRLLLDLNTLSGWSSEPDPSQASSPPPPPPRSMIRRLALGDLLLPISAAINNLWLSDDVLRQTVEPLLQV